MILFDDELATITPSAGHITRRHHTATRIYHFTSCLRIGAARHANMCFATNDVGLRIQYTPAFDDAHHTRLSLPVVPLHVTGAALSISAIMFTPALMPKTRAHEMTLERLFGDIIVYRPWSRRY